MSDTKPSRRVVNIAKRGYPVVEALESRVFLSVSPAGLTPAQVRHAYSLDQIMYPWGIPTQNVPADGRNQTIAIVDAYSDPTIASDLAVFDAQFGLPNTDVWGYSTLTIATPQGVPKVDAGWSQETALDVEWAHAMAPDADILLVEAKSSSLTDLINAANWARMQNGVVAVSMSWGGSEFQGETADDSIFTTPAGHLGGSYWQGGVTFITAGGDNGSGASYPAASPNVLSVGGTTLATDSSGNYLGEVAWSDSGGGTSTIENTSLPTVAFDGDPNTGVAVYDSTRYQGQSGWLVFGGTSVGAPAWAGIVADIDQGLNARGLGSFDGATQLIPALKNLPASDFHDITSGSNGKYTATTGYDLVTGLGTPYALGMIRDLVGSYVTGVNPTISPGFIPGTTTAKAAAVVATPKNTSSSNPFSTTQVGSTFSNARPLVDLLGMQSAQNNLDSDNFGFFDA